MLSVIDYYHYTGNSSLLKQHSAKMGQLLWELLKTVLTHPDPSSRQPGLGFVGWDDRTGAGFSNSSCVECERDFRMILLRAANETAVALAISGVDPQLAATLKQKSALLAQMLRRPTVTGHPWHTPLLLASASDAVNAGLATEAEQDAMFARVMNDSLQICQLSPFNTYWTLQALGRMGRAEQALFVLRRCYGGMIAAGATTFWETFAQAPEYISGDLPPPPAHQPALVPWTWSGITSLCHPWAAGPAYWMSQNLLGVRPLSPGFKTFEIAPMLTPSLPSVSGIVPTVHGAFEVSVDLSLGTANVTVPSGLHGRVAIPLLPGRLLTALWINGSVVSMEPESTHRQGRLPLVVTRNGIASGRYRHGDGACWIEGIGPGTHRLRWTLSASSARVEHREPTPFPPPRYRAQFVRRDNKTSGNWKKASAVAT